MQSLTIRSVIVLVILCCWFASCRRDSNPVSPSPYPIIVQADDSSVPDSLRNVYREDAARFALRKIRELGPPLNDQVLLPEDLVSSLYNALVHVHKAVNSARDSVVDIYKIHTFPRPETRRVLVAVDSSVTWVQAWKNGNRLTGNLRIDSLMIMYNLQLQEYYRWAWSHTAVLCSSVPVNARALAKRFEGILGVNYSEPDGACCDGNDITAKAEANYWLLDYSVGYDDCPSGCISRRFWMFRVYIDGSVEYIGSRGNSPPPPGECC